MCVHVRGCAAFVVWCVCAHAGALALEAGLSVDSLSVLRVGVVFVRGRTDTAVYANMEARALGGSKREYSLN